MNAVLKCFAAPALAVGLGFASLAPAAVCNLKVVTDASPDYSDLPSLIRSTTARWDTPEQKCWAMFYWNHIARRQTQPMVLHGTALTDPIRQFNDYGYTMCSTISGINCSIWDAMGFKTKYWDISLHTVPEVEYGGAWHMYDNSMSALYTLCDGKTIAGVADIGKAGACAASGGKSEPGHIAKYHCLMATSPGGFLTGADTVRGLDEEARCFNTNGLKYRPYYYDWDRGHRYILNVRDHETYTRHYHSLGQGAEFYVANGGRDPENANPRYRIRGNGVWTFQPSLTVTGLVTSAHWASNVTALPNGGLLPARAGQPGEVVFKIDGANVITALRLHGSMARATAGDANRIFISTANGLDWQEVWHNERIGNVPFEFRLTNEVNGAYEVLVKISLLAPAAPTNAQLRSLDLETTTLLNSKTQPRLALGRNTIYVGAGDPTESIVFWPDLRGDAWKPFAVAHENITAATNHPGYLGVMHAEKPNAEAFVVFRMDAPRDFTRVTYGGRLYNRAPRSHIDFAHSFDEGKTWTSSYSLTNTAPPWDVIHYETVDIVPPRTRSVLFKYALNGSAAGSSACSLYAVRMEGNHKPADASFKPLEVTFHWSERQTNYALVERAYTEIISQLPHRFTINVGGADHPVMNWLRVGAQGAVRGALPGYFDGQDAGAERFVSRWVTYGTNAARGKPYTVSVPSVRQWGAGDPNGTKLTDGIVGPPYAGGTSPSYGLCWNKGQNPVVTVDLGEIQMCGAFRIQLSAGWPWWDALKGEVKDKVEVLTSDDGQTFQSQGFFNLNLRGKDLPANYFGPDDESLTGPLFEHIPATPPVARYVQFKITAERTLTVSEVEVLNFIRYHPFDLRLALPDDPVAGR